MSDYEKIACAIRYIRAHLHEQPSLSAIAAQVNLSEHHFQRLFSRWAGVSPKRFLQVLTLEQAKKLLEQNPLSFLDASYELGLSSGSRLYDHFVQIEAVTPSEYKQAGQGLTIVYGYHDTPYGLAFIAMTQRGICQFDFVEAGQREEPLARLKEHWHQAVISNDDAETKRVVDMLFASESPVGPYFSSVSKDDRPLSLWVRGTNFQLNVWRALLKIPAGQLATYGGIAQAIGKPKAFRAVGSAIGRNPIALLIPCHRVIRQSGELGGYRWGEVRKQAILARETACEKQ